MLDSPRPNRRVRNWFALYRKELLIALLLICLLLAACARTETPSATAIPLLAVGSDSAGRTVCRAEWNPAAQTLVLGERLFAGGAGAHEGIPKMWDGGDRYVFEALPTEVLDPDARVTGEQRVEGGSLLYCSGALRVERRESGAGWSDTVIETDQSGAETSTVLPELSDPEGGGALTELVYAVREGDGLTAVLYSGGALSVCTVREGQVEGRRALAIPEELRGTVAASLDPGAVTCLDGALYLPAGEELLRCELATGAVTSLSEQLDALRALVPESGPYDAAGNPVPVAAPGAWDGILIVLVPVYTRDGAEGSIYAALAGDEIVGAAVKNGADGAWTLYGKDLRAAKPVDVAAGALRFPKGA